MPATEASPGFKNEEVSRRVTEWKSQFTIVLFWMILRPLELSIQISSSFLLNMNSISNN